MSGIVGNNTNRGSGIVKAAVVGADSITSSEIADDAIDSEHYTDGSIDNAHIADDAIDSEHYADGSIDNAHIADDAIDSEHYAAGSIDTAHIATNQIDETLMKDAFVGDFTDATVTASDYFIHGDTTDSGNTKKDTIQGILDLAGGANYKLVTANYDISTSSGTQDVTGFGFDPTFVIAFVGINAVFSSCMGMTEVGTSNYSVGARGSTTSHFPNAAFFIHVLISAGNNCSGVATTISDGIRLTWTKNGSPTGTANMYFMGFE